MKIDHQQGSKIWTEKFSRCFWQNQPHTDTREIWYPWQLHPLLLALLVFHLHSFNTGRRPHESSEYTTERKNRNGWAARSVVNQQMHVKLRDRRYTDSSNQYKDCCDGLTRVTDAEYIVLQQQNSRGDLIWNWRQVTIRNASIPACTQDQKLNPDKYEHQSFRGIDMRLGSLRRSWRQMRSLRR